MREVEGAASPFYGILPQLIDASGGKDEGFRITMVDLDSDSQLDLIIMNSTGHMHYYRNEGTMKNPVFAKQIKNPFLAVPSIGGVKPMFVDLDSDGTLDLVVGIIKDGQSQYGYYKQTGTTIDPIFTLQTNSGSGWSCLELTTVAYMQCISLQFSSDAPVMVDLNADSKFDLIVGTYGGNIRYYMNTGTINNTRFT
jgi:hypothetical protein